MQREGLYSWENPEEHEQICHTNVWQFHREKNDCKINEVQYDNGQQTLLYHQL